MLALAAVSLVLSLFKKLIKLAFTALALLLLVAGIWYFSQRDPKISSSLQRAQDEAAEKLKEVAGEALDKAADSVKEGAERAMDRAAEAVKEGAARATATDSAAGDEAGEGEGEDQEPNNDLAKDTSEQ